MILSQAATEVRPDCDHVWGEEYHTQLGHETLGSHAAHVTCTTCGWTKSTSLGREETYWCSPSSQAYFHILPRPHLCSAGWRGVVVYHAEYGAGMPPLPGRGPSAPNLYGAKFDCPCCLYVRTMPYGSVCRECSHPLHRLRLLITGNCSSLQRWEQERANAIEWNRAYGIPGDYDHGFL